MSGAATPIPPRHIWAVMVPREGSLPPAALETLEEARVNADSRAAVLTAVLVVDDDPGGAVSEAARYGADAVALVTGSVSAPASAVATALADRIRAEKPDGVLFAGTARGTDIGARVGAVLRRRFADRCIRFTLEESSATVVRTVRAGRKHTEERWSRGPFLAAMMPGVVGVGAGDEGRGTPEPTHWPMAAEPTPETVVSRTLGDPREQDLRECDVIVSGGRGVGGPAGLGLIEELADALGAGIGGSRPVIEAGWLPYERQVGQTGRTVAPRLYIACGVSGATQHLAGIQAAETVISINSDPSAPIGARADLAIVGDLHEVLPELIKRIREIRSRQAASERSAS